ncbi:DNA replication ATP-dependent helicase/nuclease DNA2 [Dendroctonus ponderosae]|uniref:DNA replication ATP-dependent helicase/nuclease DNA2 n=1 Tax=Dendroctonus ponderosae TaxID=77166 RepID=UPI00203531A1|nr:DNA replication ATP-dependent helicase/nuclease DNA2 [Dendroctonus ponderosae]
MSRGPIKSKSAQGCMKISSFFAKKGDPVPKPVKLLTPTVISEIINIASDEEQYENMPNGNRKPERNKRKSEDHGLSPPMKKITMQSNQAGAADAESPVLVPSTSGCTSLQNHSKISVKSPEKLLSPAAFNDYLTSGRNVVCVSSTEKWTPPKKDQIKANITKSSSKKSETTPSKKRRTPKKLFEVSPININQFKVEVLENFIKFSPAKREAEDADQITRRKSLQIQKQNEKTPVKTSEPPCKHGTSKSSPAARVRTKLNFDNIRPPGKVTVSPKIQKAVHQEDNSPEDLTLVFDDINWNLDADLLESGDYTLDLTDPQHCKVVNVNQYATEMVVVVKSTQRNEQALCYLRDFWMYSKLCIADTVRITAVKNHDIWLVDNQNGFLVFEPDLLVSTTTIVNSVFCKRQTVFKEKFRGFDPTNKFMIVGSMVHALLQDVLRNKWFELIDIERCALEMLQKAEFTRQLYGCGETTANIAEEFLNYVPQVGEFVKTYVQSGQSKVPKKGAWKGRISEIVDIEENIWCPDLGVKGKVDVTIRTEAGLMPLEVKTGRATVSLEHRGQVMLYIMMMSKLGYSVSSGLLLYLKEGAVKEIPSSAIEKRDLVILRNDLVYYLSRTPEVATTPNGKYLKPAEVPETINHSGCSKCAYSGICMAYSKYANEDVSSKKSLQQIHNNLDNYITSTHIDYFMHWSSLLSIEMPERNGAKDIRDIYTLKPEERKSKGKCLIDLEITDVTEEFSGLYLTTFAHNQQQADNFLLSGFLENTYVVVSTKTRPAVATGLIADISMHSVSVNLDRNLQKKYSKAIFFLDYYDSTIFLTYNLASLSLILDTTTERSNRLRSIVIDKQPATFQPKLPKCLAGKARPILKRLNKVQQRAVLKAIAAKDYFLIKGMPGTGKTATIVALVQLLIELKKTVLITSHTHSAVDTVCLKLVNFGVSFMRLGNEAKINPSLKKFSEYSFIKDCKTPEDLAAVYNSVQVLAVTCLASGHSILSKRNFDVCIVDESTQVLQCSVFRPLHAADTFILIGDPDQLPAVVRNKTAVELGMRESLFERLDSPESCISLNLNYRMNEPITALANALTYGGELMIGAERIAKASVNIPKFNQISASCNKWLVEALDTKLENAVKFIDTGPVWNLTKSATWAQDFRYEALQSQEHHGSFNIFEAALIYRLVKALLNEGEVPAEHIGVIATYRIQVALLTELLKSSKVEVNTVDQFQGKDKNIILYSCSKSKDLSEEWKDNNFDLTEDKRRLNVAITRAKHKLIIVGDLGTLQNYSTFKKIKPQLENNVIKLRGCEGFHWDAVLDFQS